MIFPLILNTVGIAQPQHGIAVIGAGPLPPVPPDMCDSGESSRRAALVMSEADARWGKHSWASQTVALQYRGQRCERQPYGECRRTDDPLYECRDVTVEELRSDPAGVFTKAERLGTLRLLDAEGNARLLLSVIGDDGDD